MRVLRSSITCCLVRENRLNYLRNGFIWECTAHGDSLVVSWKHKGVRRVLSSQRFNLVEGENIQWFSRNDHRERCSLSASTYRFLVVFLDSSGIFFISRTCSESTLINVQVFCKFRKFCKVKSVV